MMMTRKMLKNNPGDGGKERGRLVQIMTLKTSRVNYLFVTYSGKIFKPVFLVFAQKNA